MRRAHYVFLVLLLTGATAAPAASFTNWMTSSRLTHMLHEMSENREFPARVEGRLEGEQIQYRAQFVPYLPKMDYFESRWGMSQDWYVAYSKQLISHGFNEYSRTVFHDIAGNVLYQVTWVLIGPKPSPTRKVSNAI
jgi:hypothetical protein